MITRLRQLRPGVRRAIAVTTLSLFVLIFTTGPATAADGGSNSGGGGGALGWIKIKDSYGVYIWQFTLNVDEGGVTSIGKAVWSALTTVVFSLYKLAAVLSLWLIDWVTSLDWLYTLTKPVMALGDGMSLLVDRLGLVPTLLLASTVMAVFWLARGMWARGIYELAMTAVIFALAGGVFAQPVQMIAGRDGAVVKANQLGLEVSGSLQGTDTSKKTVKQLRQEQSSRLADVFISDPHQVVNFGSVLSPKCEKVYEAELVKPPKIFGGGNGVRDAVKSCDKAAGEWAENPSGDMFMSAVVFMPATGAVMLLAMLAAGAVLIAGFTAMFLSVKLIWDLLVALGPSGIRSGLWSSVAELVMALAMVVFTSSFLGGLLVFVEYVFTAGRANGDAAVKTFAIADVVLIVGCVVFWRWKNKVQAAAERLKASLGKRPGAAAATASRPQSLRPMVHTASQAAHTLGMRRLRKQNDDLVTGAQNSGNTYNTVVVPGQHSNTDAGKRVDGEFVDVDATRSHFGGPAPKTPRKMTPARLRLEGKGLQTGTVARSTQSRLGAAATKSAGTLTAGTSSAALQASRAAARKRSALKPSPRRAELTSRLQGTTTPSPARYTRVVRDGQVIYTPLAGS